MKLLEEILNSDTVTDTQRDKISEVAEIPIERDTPFSRWDYNNHYMQTTAPKGASPGDVWFNTRDRKVYYRVTRFGFSYWAESKQ